jgi:F-type H+-transporting ATPase subunit a
MPEHQTWFRYLPNYEALRAVLEGDLGQTWLVRQPLDLQHVLGALLVVLVLLVFGILVWRKVRDAKAALVPEAKLTPRTFAELLTETVLGQLEGMIGAKAARFFLPFIGSLALFILFSNALGMIPGFGPPTGNLNTTLACAVIVVVTVEAYGFAVHGLGYLKEFAGGLEGWYWWITPLPYLMFVIEVIGHLARLISLSIRLLANMYADHAVVALFATLIPFVPVVVPLPAQALGVLVVVVQAAVFCLLSMVYISLALGEHEAGEHGSH